MICPFISIHSASLVLSRLDTVGFSEDPSVVSTSSPRLEKDNPEPELPKNYKGSIFMIFFSL